jgi:hypothetical protein
MNKFNKWNVSTSSLEALEYRLLKGEAIPYSRFNDLTKDFKTFKRLGLINLEAVLINGESKDIWLVSDYHKDKAIAFIELLRGETL